MRVDNKQLDTVGSAANAGAAQKVGSQGRQLSTTSTGVSSDQASLSSASNLVALARNATSTARQSKIDALTKQVQGGNYQGSTAQAGKAMVQELLQTSTSAAH